MRLIQVPIIDVTFSSPSDFHGKAKHSERWINLDAICQLVENQEGQYLLTTVTLTDGSFQMLGSALQNAATLNQLAKEIK